MHPNKTLQKPSVSNAIPKKDSYFTEVDIISIKDKNRGENYFSTVLMLQLFLFIC